MSFDRRMITSVNGDDYWVQVVYDLVNIKDLRIGDEILSDLKDTTFNDAVFYKIIKINKVSIWVQKYTMTVDGGLMNSQEIDVKMNGTVFYKIASRLLGDKIMVSEPEVVVPVKMAKFPRLFKTALSEWYYDGAEEYQDYLEKNAEQVVELLLMYLSDYVAEETKEYDIETTIVSGITCKKCGNDLPDMTMKEHLDGNFNQECPHT